MDKNEFRLSDIAYFSSGNDVHECPFFPHFHELKLNGHKFDYYGPEGSLAKALSELILNGFEYPELTAKEEPGQLNAMIIRGCLDVVPKIEKMWSEANFKPKVIMADMYSVYASILAQKFKIPLLTLYPGLFVDPSSDDFDETTEKILNEPIEEHLRSKASEIEKKYNIKLTRHADAFVRGDRNISAFPKLFGEQLVKETSSSIYVGPSFIDEKKLDDSTLIDVEIAKGNLVAVSLGVTPFVENAFDSLDAIIKALTDTDYNVLISTTPSKAKEIFEKGVPSNFSVKSDISQMYLLNNSDLFITHFGPKGIMKAIACKIPMVGIPRARDQFANGKIVEKLNLGKCLTDLTSENICKTVQEVMGSEEIKKALEKHQAMISPKKSREDFFNIVMELMK